ncbi:TadE/TadG family type IV pilus assembly protein [Streptomyces sp. NPDC102360]|uniref:TadE/TadG family type IV pilus assembly protein n=1 Tax=Streptomyces sp. NPDC102360 TaxID=3366160 RepID=UPI00380CA393
MRRVGRGRSRAQGGAETGAATIELVFTVPALILMLWFLVFCGRMTDARLRVEDAAHQAARSASSQRTMSIADARAWSTAVEALKSAGTTCESLDVVTRGSVQSGGTVRTTVTCRVELSDLALLQVPGSADIAIEFASPVDVHRGTQRGPGTSGVSSSENRIVGAVP